MRLRRHFPLVMTMTILLLAVAGFAAFSPSAPPRDTVIVTSGGSAAGYAAGSLFAGVGRAIEAAREQPVTSEAPTTTIAPTVVTSGYLTERQVRQTIALYFEPADLDRAVRVAWCESSFNASSVDVRTGGEGIFHIDPALFEEVAADAGVRGRDILDPDANVAVAAYLVYQTEAGWSSFVCQG